jgi:hypothetical protein
MYRHCEILRCDLWQPGEKVRQPASMEDLLTLISK